MRRDALAGLVLLPKKMEVVNIETKKLVHTWYSLDWTVVAMGNLDIRASLGGGAGGRFGVGLIWGEL